MASKIYNMDRVIKMESFGMSSNLSFYQLKIDCYKPMMLYVNFMVTTKQKPISNTPKREKRVRERKLNNKSNHKGNEQEKKGT